MPHAVGYLTLLIVLEMQTSQYADASTRSKLCFCTAAYGNQYLELARLLANDLQRFAPKSPLVIVTNRPGYFSDLSNVLAIKHHCRGVEPHHERRFAVNYGLSISDTVIVLDSDVRILAPVPDELVFKPGLAAKSCGSLQKHMERWLERPSKRNLKIQKIVHEMAQRSDVNINSPDLKFINEFLFAITKDNGREKDFLKVWGDLATFADTLGLHRHPTFAMAIALAKTDFPIYQHEMPGLVFFDDRVTKWNIQQGKAELTPQIQNLFEQHLEVEYGKNSIIKRIQRKLERIKYQILSLPYNRLRVKITEAIAPESLRNYPDLDSSIVNK